MGYASDGSIGIVVSLGRRGAAPWTATSIQHVTRSLNGVACPSTSRCVAVGSGVVVITNGTPGSLQQLPAGVTLNGVACATPEACEAVGTIDAADGNGPAVWAPITNGVIGAIHRVSGSEVLEAIACPTLTICLAVGEANGVTEASWRSPTRSAGALKHFADIYDAYSISCPTADLCAVAGYATGGIGPAQALVALHQRQDRCFANPGRRHNVPRGGLHRARYVLGCRGHPPPIVCPACRSPEWIEAG